MGHKRFLKYEFIFINIGLIIVAFALSNFLVPAKLATGGVSGLATIVYHLYKIPVGWTMLAINIPIFLFGIYIFGKAYGAKSIYGMFMLSVFCNLVYKYMTFSYFTSLAEHSQITGSLIGGTFIGIGLSLVLGFGMNVGGTVIIAQVLNHKYKFKIGTCMLMADITIIILSSVSFGFKSAFIAGASLIVMSQVLNFATAKIHSIKTISLDKKI